MRQNAIVLGELRFTLPDRATGWCMLADQPQTRVTVEILVDGKVVVAMVAAQRSDGPGDGRHGFAVSLPVPITGQATRVIEARARGTGLIFARIVLYQERLTDTLTTRLSGLDVSILRAPINAVPVDAEAALRGVFGKLAGALWHHPSDDLRAARIDLSLRAPRLALSATPALSVILPSAPNAAETVARLVGLQLLCDEIAAEILLADDGSDPATLLLPQIVPGLRLLRCPGGLSGDALNLAAALGRAAALCVIDPSPPAAMWAWPALPACAVHLGGAAAREAAAAAAPGKPAARDCGPHGFALRVSRSLLEQAGGFEPSLPSGAACADLAAKCALLGAPVSLWLDQEHDHEVWPANARPPRRAAKSGKAPARRRATAATRSSAAS